MPGRVLACAKCWRVRVSYLCEGLVTCAGEGLNLRLVLLRFGLQSLLLDK